VGQAVVKTMIRFPATLHERLVERRRLTHVPTNYFVEQAVAEKLDREHPDKPKRRKAAS
jgi:predicted HicB family RNase H-like nuclease